MEHVRDLVLVRASTCEEQSWLPAGFSQRIVHMPAAGIIVQDQDLDKPWRPEPLSDMHRRQRL